MPYGHHGKILHIDLDESSIRTEEPDSSFYRKYVGGSAMGAYYLLKLTPPGTDPLSPQNTLSLMVSAVTGAAISGLSRVAATAKSPLTGLVGESAAGGFWPAELKFAGFDGIVVRGRAENPVYLWVHNGDAELRDASRLWGRFTADAEDMIREELGDRRIHVLQCGPAAEKGVRFGALINNANRANARTGMGTVMASKNFKAVAVQGSNRPELADPKALRALAKWGGSHLAESGVAGFNRLGTAGMLVGQSLVGGLPTRNWASGTFERAEDIGGELINETIIKERDTCFGCVVRCKPVVEITEGRYAVDPRYGGPEYETLAALGAYCGVSDLAAVTYANQLCNMYGMDTISCGATIAWAMDCFQRGLLTTEDTGGIDLRFGNAEALVGMVELIGKREGFGHILGEGSARAARHLEVGSELVVAAKGQEYPAHMPHVKGGIALLYTVHPGGADHTILEHDPSYMNYPEKMAQLGLIDPQPSSALNDEKVYYAVTMQRLLSFIDSACMCKFAFGPAWQLFDVDQMLEAVRSITGWDVTLQEVMEVGERRLNMLRAFNAREGVGAEADTIPSKMAIPLEGGATDGVAISKEAVEEAKALYYRMVGWDEDGRPTRDKLVELGLEWVAEELWDADER
jgi:aldehyde:ferredoxin oxidoreductase